MQDTLSLKKKKQTVIGYVHNTLNHKNLWRANKR